LALAALVGGAFFGVQVTSARAAVQPFLEFDLTSCHFDPSSGCGPAGTVYGTVTLTDIGTNTVAVDVTLTPGNVFAVGGAGYSLAWDLPSLTGEIMSLRQRLVGS
jgi:hypothetical protein